MTAVNNNNNPIIKDFGKQCVEQGTPSARICARHWEQVLSERGIRGRMSREPGLLKVLHPEGRRGTGYTGLNPGL